ncbi:hypothetical protein [Halorubrum saccharovorum]|uniref:hypothetical protein n=1 Tax=Halorubrum saccharovorum TaxID=2248 RepID=UPI0006787556|nr:hypothetical protein [Halorubrum saccharovorum]
MPRAVLLRCPICDAVRALDGTRDARSKAELRATAKAHLRDHARDESPTAIRKHQTVETAAEIIVSADDIGRLPTDEWRNPGSAWLPEGVPSPDAPPMPASGRRTRRLR